MFLIKMFLINKKRVQDITSTFLDDMKTSSIITGLLQSWLWSKCWLAQMKFRKKLFIYIRK